MRRNIPSLNRNLDSPQAEESGSTAMRRAFKGDYNIAAIGWNLPFYEKKYGEEQKQTLSDFCDTLQKIQSLLNKKRTKIELLLCAGLTLYNRDGYAFKKSSEEITSSLKRLTVPNIGAVLFEIMGDSHHYFLFRWKPLQTRSFPDQYFAHCRYSAQKDANPIDRKKSKRLQDALIKERRSFSIGDRKFALIICGENNMIQNNRPETMTPLIITFSPLIENAKMTADLLRSSIVLNPSHAVYGINGKKRLLMMKNVTGHTVRYKKINFKIPIYLHANNYSSQKNDLDLSKINRQILSESPNGSFLFKAGRYQKTSFSGRDDDDSFIINVWSV
jgi:hypothetical protein